MWIFKSKSKNLPSSTIPKINVNTKSKTNLSFKSKTKPNKSKPLKKSSQIHKNVKPQHKIKIQSQLQIQNQQIKTPKKNLLKFTKMSNPNTSNSLYEKSPSHLYVVNKLNQWVTHRVKVTLGASHSFDSQSHPLACNCNSSLCFRWVTRRVWRSEMSRS